MVEADRLGGAGRSTRPSGIWGKAMRAWCPARLDPGCAGQGFADLDDQVGQFDQLHQDLVHIVHQGDQVARGHAARIDLDGAGVQQGHNGQVDDDIGQGVGQGRQVPYPQLQVGQLAVVCSKRDVSLASLPKARTTRTPVRFSRVRPSTRSSRACTFL